MAAKVTQGAPGPTGNTGPTGATGLIASHACRVTGSEPMVRAAPGTTAKLAINTVATDPDSWWNTTSKRYIPQLAGRYLVTAYFSGAAVGGAGDVNNDIQIRKNGSTVATDRRQPAATNYGPELSITYQVALNGTTDYVELWGGIGHLTLTTTLAGSEQFDIVYIGPN